MPPAKPPSPPEIWPRTGTKLPTPAPTAAPAKPVGAAVAIDIKDWGTVLKTSNAKPAIILSLCKKSPSSGWLSRITLLK